MPPTPRRRQIIDVDPVVENDEPQAPKWDMDLDEIDAQVAEALGTAPQFTIRLSNGEVVVVRPATLLSDDRTAAMMRVQAGDDLDRIENAELRAELAGYLDAETLERVWKSVEPHVRVPGRTVNGAPADPDHIRLAKAILGDEDYARLIAGGGSAYRAMWAFGKLNEATPQSEAESPKSLKSSRS